MLHTLVAVDGLLALAESVADGEALSWSRADGVATGETEALVGDGKQLLLVGRLLRRMRGYCCWSYFC